MTQTAEPHAASPAPPTSQALDEVKIGGLGSSRTRVEDARFIRGRGNYVEDVTLPGMLHMEILRSPLAHARIRSIDTSAAWAIPGVKLVLTGEMAAQRNLAWMPTLSYDTQAVLATDKVRFQGQEVACVVADDPYIAKDACDAIVVDYEPLPPVVSPEQAVAPGAPLIRDDKAGQADNIAYQWEVGDKDGTDAAFAPPCRRRLEAPAALPAQPPVADRELRRGRGLQQCHRQAHRLPDEPGPPAHRAGRGGLIAELPEHLIRIISPDVGGGSATRCPSTRATCARSCARSSPRNR